MGKFRYVTVLATVLLLALVVSESAAAEFNQQVRMGRKLQQALTLQQCLARGGARTAFPGTTEYNNARGAFNKRNLYAPAAFVFPTTVAQVQNAIMCSKQVGVGIVPRGGGHSFEDYSLGGRDGVLVVDMVGFKRLTYNSAAKTAVVGSGWRLGPLYLALWNAGKVTIPGGNCPTVGLAGHALGGGWGFSSRKFGTVSDTILELQLVVANGTLVIANANQNRDLYFALRGAGATSYGIVTQFTFRVFDVSFPVTHFKYKWPSTAKSLQFQNFKAYQLWGVNVPNNISAAFYMDPAGQSWLEGVYLGPRSSFSPHVQSFLSRAGPSPQTNVEQLDWIHTVLVLAGYASSSDPNTLNNVPYPTNTFKAKSVFVNAPGMSDQGINAMLTAMRAGNNNAYFIFDLYGSQSAINKVSPSASAFVHRSSLYSIQMVAYWSNANDAAGQTTYIRNYFNAVRPYATGAAYQNYIDRDMPLSVYYGASLGTLIQGKRKWDPANLFTFPQSIPLS